MQNKYRYGNKNGDEQFSEKKEGGIRHTETSVDVERNMMQSWTITALIQVSNSHADYFSLGTMAAESLVLSSRWRVPSRCMLSMA